MHGDKLFTVPECQSAKKCLCVGKLVMTSRNKTDFTPSVHRKIQYYVTWMCLDDHQFSALRLSTVWKCTLSHILQPIDVLFFFLSVLHLNLHKNRIFSNQNSITEFFLLCIQNPLKVHCKCILMTKNIHWNCSQTACFFNVHCAHCTVLNKKSTNSYAHLNQS